MDAPDPLNDPIVALAHEAERRTDEGDPAGGLALARPAVELADADGGRAVAELAESLRPSMPGDRWP